MTRGTQADVACYCGGGVNTENISLQYSDSSANLEIPPTRSGIHVWPLCVDFFELSWNAAAVPLGEAAVPVLPVVMRSGRALGGLTLGISSQDKLYQEEYRLVSSEAEREELLQKLSEASSWMEEEGFAATTKVWASFP